MRFRFPRGGGSYLGPYAIQRMTGAAEYTQRDGARIEYFNSKYWILGGWQPTPNVWSATNAVTNEIWSSPDLVTWTQEATHVDTPPTSGAGARWHPRHTHMTCVFDSKLWVFGSDQYDPGGSVANPSLDPISSDVWNSTDGTTWTRVAADNLATWGHTRGVYDSIAGVYGGYIHIIGGYRADGVEARTAWPSTSEHWRSADGITWTQLTDIPFSRARTLNAISVGGRLVVVGGISSPSPVGLNPAVAMNDVWTWDGSTWTQTSDGSGAPFEGRSWFAVAGYDGKLWALTGWDDDATLNRGSAFWSSDFGATWNELPAGTVGYPPSHADGVAATADGIALVCGFRQQRNTWLLSRGTPDDVDYPGTLPLSAWWRSYDGSSPWHGSYSTDGSGGNHLTEATNPPAAGAALNGHDTADFDGTNDKMTAPAITNGHILAGTFSIWWLFNADSAVADPGAAVPYGAPGVDDTSGAGLAIGFCAAGVRAGYFDGTTWDSVAQAASTGAWHLARIRSDGTKIELSVDSNAWTSVSRTAPLSPGGVLRVGTCYAGVFFNGRIAEVGATHEVLSDVEFDAIKTYVNSHYGLAL